MIVQHRPQGDPCETCGLPASKHRAFRPEHVSDGDPCKRCGLAAEDHRNRKAYHRTRPKRQSDRMIVGIDGEGQDTPDGGHIYTYLCAVNEEGRIVSEAWNPDGLTHDECCDMLLAIPRNTLKFGYMFSYDVTMICRDMPKEDKVYLVRPDARRRFFCRDCRAKWIIKRDACPSCHGIRIREFRRHLDFNGRSYDWFNGSFTVASSRKEKHRRSMHLWDCFKFFQSSFVEALTLWDVGTPEQRARIKEMKDQRGKFQDLAPDKVKAYCQEECHLLAVMMRKVIAACEKAGIDLKRYEGAGSIATALLKKYDVASYRGPRLRDMTLDLRVAVLSAFSGGHFENAIMGSIERPCYGYDIASAYPYAQTFLPCLRCGTWEFVRGKGLAKALESATLAAVHFYVRPVKDRTTLAWAPLPFRIPDGDEQGSITWAVNFSGWAWKEEALAAVEGWPDLVVLTGAWIYRTACEHRPFGFLPSIYRQRFEWGKDGAGIVLKLGPNATYGKTAQNVGSDPPYQDWVWAGVTTSNTRAQLLRAIIGAGDRWNILSVATDGIYAAEPLNLPLPRDTGTSDLYKDGQLKALGAWEKKDIPEGMYFQKPGMYFRLRNANIKEMRARGIGRKELFEERTTIVDAFKRWDREDFTFSVVAKSRRFHGIKQSFLPFSRCARCKKTWAGVPHDGCPKCGMAGTSFDVTATYYDENDPRCGREKYGTWEVRRVDIAFNPCPKRERCLDKDGTFTRLLVRDGKNGVSAPYRGTTPEGIRARELRESLMFQPDWDEGRLVEDPTDEV